MGIKMKNITNMSDIELLETLNDTVTNKNLMGVEDNNKIYNGVLAEIRKRMTEKKW